MPNPQAIEAAAIAVAKGAEAVGEKLFGDTFAPKVARIAEKVAGNSAAKPGYEALTSHIRASLLGNPEKALAANTPMSTAAERQLEKALAANSGRVKDVKVWSGTSFIEGRWQDRSGFQAQVIEKETPRVLKTADAAPVNNATGDALNKAANRTSDQASEKVASPAIIKPRDPVMPTQAFEMNGERKIVTKLDDGSLLTEYPGAPLPFKFPSARGEIGSYGHFAASVKQLPDGSVSLANPEGIDKIGSAWEKAANTLGLQTPILNFHSMPNWFKGKFEHLADSGVPAWFRGDSSWIYGQVNGAKLVRPVEANFSRSGALQQIRYDAPVKITAGPFEGLSGDALGFTNNKDAVLVNTARLVGERPETFVYRAGRPDIETWRQIPTGADQTEIRRVLLTPRAFISRVEK